VLGWVLGAVCMEIWEIHGLLSLEEKIFAVASDFDGGEPSALFAQCLGLVDKHRHTRHVARQHDVARNGLGQRLNGKILALLGSFAGDFGEGRVIVSARKFGSRVNVPVGSIHASLLHVEKVAVLDMLAQRLPQVHPHRHRNHELLLAQALIRVAADDALHRLLLHHHAVGRALRAVVPASAATAHGHKDRARWRAPEATRRHHCAGTPGRESLEHTAGLRSPCVGALHVCAGMRQKPKASHFYPADPCRYSRAEAAVLHSCAWPGADIFPGTLPSHAQSLGLAAKRTLLLHCNVFSSEYSGWVRKPGGVSSLGAERRNYGGVVKIYLSIFRFVPQIGGAILLSGRAASRSHLAPTGADQSQGEFFNKIEQICPFLSKK